MVVEATGAVGRGGVAAGGLGWSKGVLGLDRVVGGKKMFVRGWFCENSEGVVWGRRL